MHESDCGDCFFVIESFGVGQPGESVDRRMQVHIAGSGSGFGGRGNSSSLDASFAVNTPAAAIGDPADLLHVDVNHVTRPRATMGCGARLDCPHGSMNRRRFRANATRCLLTVRR